MLTTKTHLSWFDAHGDTPLERLSWPQLRAVLAQFRACDERVLHIEAQPHRTLELTVKTHDREDTRCTAYALASALAKQACVVDGVALELCVCDALRRDGVVHVSSSQPPHALELRWRAGVWRDDDTEVPLERLDALARRWVYGAMYALNDTLAECGCRLASVSALDGCRLALSVLVTSGRDAEASLDEAAHWLCALDGYNALTLDPETGEETQVRVTLSCPEREVRYKKRA